MPTLGLGTGWKGCFRGDTGRDEPYGAAGGPAPEVPRPCAILDVADVDDPGLEPGKADLGEGRTSGVPLA